jgi:hypothetical protein
MDIKEMARRVHCCSCGGKIRRINLVELDRRAAWKYPTAGNVITGEEGKAVAILCDPCIEHKVTITEAVEFTEGGAVLYHPIESLEKWR